MGEHAIQQPDESLEASMGTVLLLFRDFIEDQRDLRLLNLQLRLDFVEVLHALEHLVLFVVKQAELLSLVTFRWPLIETKGSDR